MKKRIMAMLAVVLCLTACGKSSDDVMDTSIDNTSIEESAETDNISVVMSENEKYFVNGMLNSAYTPCELSTKSAWDIKCDKDGFIDIRTAFGFDYEDELPVKIDSNTITNFSYVIHNHDGKYEHIIGLEVSKKKQKEYTEKEWEALYEGLEDRGIIIDFSSDYLVNFRHKENESLYLKVEDREDCTDYEYRILTDTDVKFKNTSDTEFSLNTKYLKYAPRKCLIYMPDLQATRSEYNINITTYPDAPLDYVEGLALTYDFDSEEAAKRLIAEYEELYKDDLDSKEDKDGEIGYRFNANNSTLMIKYCDYTQIDEESKKHTTAEGLTFGVIIQYVYLHH